MLWSIMDPEAVFAAPPEPVPALLDVPLPVPGARLLCRGDGRGGAVVERLFATDPRLYLDPRYQPGAAAGRR